MHIEAGKTDRDCERIFVLYFPLYNLYISL